MISGTVAINEDQILFWFATREEQATPGDYRYECFAKGRDHKGYPIDTRFSVYHRPSDGALRLTEKIMGCLDYRVRYATKFEGMLEEAGNEEIKFRSE